LFQLDFLSFSLAVPKFFIIILVSGLWVIKAYSYILAVPELFHCFLWVVEAYSNNQVQNGNLNFENGREWKTIIILTNPTFP